MGGYDLHVHTRHSYDSLQSPRRVLDAARRRGLDGVAIADHDAFEGARRAAAMAEDVRVIKGMEIRTEDYDDLLGLFLDEPVEARTFAAAVAEIHDRGGIAVLPHPYRKFDSVPDRILDLVDAVESFNSRSRERSNSAAAGLAEGESMPRTGGSDAHTRFEVGNARTYFPPEASTAADLKRAIARGETEVAGDESPYYPAHGASVAVELLKSGLETI